MKINKKQLDILASLPDEAMRRVIQAVAAGNGVDISSLSFSSAELSKLRSVLRCLDDSDVERATEILKNSKLK